MCGLGHRGTRGAHLNHNGYSDNKDEEEIAEKDKKASEMFGSLKSLIMVMLVNRLT